MADDASIELLARRHQMFPVLTDAEIARIRRFGTVRHYRRGDTVGGGNSAGQAAVFLARHAAKVFVLVRGPSLAASMSRYLIDRIEATSNIELKPHTELTRLHGDAPSGLAGVTWRDRRDGVEEQRSLLNLFLFVGADPETSWMKGCGVTVDANGFVLTGPAAAGGADGHAPAPLETSVPGVFAVGDVRSGSVKRVGAAIGEGAAAVAQIHAVLAAAHAARGADAGAFSDAAAAAP